MQATTTGNNRTGAAVSPDGVQAMTEAVLRLSPNPPSPINTADANNDRAVYIAEAEPLGSIPPPVSFSGALKAGVGTLMGDRPELLMDKMGERIAFERAGVRLYDALIAKYAAVTQSGEDLPSLAEALAASGEDWTAQTSALLGETPLQSLERIRNEELQHFHLLCDAMESLGGDPTAQTPCADVAGVASAGLMQVVTDPRTTLAQCLTAVLSAELTDGAGWELLIQLTEQGGHDELTGKFLTAHGQEVQHQQAIQGWLSSLLLAEKATALV